MLLQLLESSLVDERVHPGLCKLILFIFVEIE